ncbi:M20/M25/M40 family metallo-hydrolase [Nocardioides bizhenqiangii]|uniref:M20/M25/M40 family metallo-hydrolase n=1 Tax=Nocardioides bizhenqiangii TaxID=3095076 RepID=A0ABZ0ZKU1_9ACTN|nr:MULTISPECIES: M20/M25/M40 family metallo-hydrolase [unclassified Nocardioides]MDZ5620230.1 M20/M25/M40 family metallo-hydrolase [Nocardioides sp. HM23]WQQ24606.1 M20/M25/M40 family metallo-hydrolase [Nocardioides sp. HM61]
MEGMDEVVEICRDLIRIDTTNYGSDDGPGERKAAEHVAGLLEEVGIETRLYESTPGRASVFARWGGDGSRSDALLLHGHLDVVPAAAEDWQVHPFSGEVQDGYVWGRGAVDMKDFDAMLLAVVRERQRAGRIPTRPIVMCFTADEEAGGHLGAEVMVRDHREEFEGCTEAVGEVGGWSTTVRGRRLYLIEAAEKGMAWMRLTARGRAGHGSMINPDNAVTRIATAVARIGAHEWPVRLTPTMRTLLATVGELAGTEATPENARDLVEEFGGATRMLGAVLSNTTNPTMLGAGYKVNVIPTEATAHVDGRTLPGYEDEFFRTLAELCGDDISIDYVSNQPPWETPYDGALVDAMTRSLVAEDPDALVAPYLMSGGTDAKHFLGLGMRTYGFTPLRLPEDLDFTALFHGVDERVPVDALKFGARVMDRFLDQV